ncbi:MAG: hypothetical protein WAW23_03600 [Candidatus Methanoperedens sp.]
MRSFTDEQLKTRAEAVKKASGIMKRVISVLQQPCFVQFTDQDTEDYQISELNAVLSVLEASPPGPFDVSAVLITQRELRECVVEELKDHFFMPPDGIIEDLVSKLTEHFDNDLSQWKADNIKDFFNRADILKMVEV